MSKIKLIIVDDHQVIRDGIKLGLKFDKNIEVIGEAECYEELMGLLEKTTPDIIILDIGLPGKNGVEITEEISSKYKILIFSASDDAEMVVNAIQAGAKGFLQKKSFITEIDKAIHSIVNGEEYITEEISNKLLVEYINKKVDVKTPPDLLNKLTKRELEIMKEIASGLSYKEIGEKLFISARTVETHKTHIMQKLNLKNLAELIKFAIKNKLIEI